MSAAKVEPLDSSADPAARLRRWLAVVRQLKPVGILLCVALVFVACGKADRPLPEGEMDPGNVLRIDVAASFGSLNPALDVHSGSTAIYPFLHSYLCVPNAEGGLESDLASGWLYDPSRFIWTIHLREDVRFHDGRVVMAEDVKSSFEEVFKNLQSMVRSILVDAVDSITTPEPHVVQFKLHQDDPEFLSKVWGIEIVPASAAGSASEKYVPVGSGPFVFDYRRDDGEVGLKANEHYYRGRPSLDRVVFYHVPDRESSWARIIQGKTDMVREVYPKDYEMIRDRTDLFQFYLGTSQYFSVLLYNTHDPLLAEPHVRRALSHAIDTDHIIKEILRGMGMAAGGPGGVDTFSGNPQVKPVSYDPGRALELLGRAGWAMDEKGRYLSRGGRGFELELLYFSRYQVDERVAEYLQLCFNDIGIKARIKSMPFDKLVMKYASSNDFQAVLTEMRGVCGTPEILHVLWGNGTERVAFAGCFSHPEVNRLLEQAKEESDPSRKRDLYRRAEAVIASLQPGSFLFHRIFADVVSTRIVLPPAFSFVVEDIHRLWQASVKPRGERMPRPAGALH